MRIEWCMADLDVTLSAELYTQLQALLKGGQAHATYDDAVDGLPAELRGVVPEGLPYSAWQLVEHLRITLKDILEFSDNTEGKYKHLAWPDAYWPKEKEPRSEQAWSDSIEEYKKDLAVFEALVKKGDLVTPFPWGDGQNLLREALLVADHAAYHVGELIVLRRLLGAWK